MTKRLLTLIIALLSLQMICAKVIENPRYEFRNSIIPHVTKVELTPTETILHLRCTFKPKWWIMFDDKTTIKNSNGEQVYKMISMEGGEFNEKLKTPACGYQDIVLHFEAIDSSITEIDYGDADDDWCVYGIDLTGTKGARAWSSILPEELYGNWSDKAGVDGWCYGLWEDCALIDNRFWEYSDVKKHKGGYKLDLSCEGESRTLYLKASGEDLAIGSAPNPRSLYTKDRPQYTTSGISTTDIDPLKGGEVVLNGYIEGYSPRSGFESGIIYTDDIITRKSNQALITIDESGRFHSAFDLAHATECHIRIGNLNLSLTAIPCDTISIYLSYEGILQQRLKTENTPPSDMKFMGKYGRLNQEMIDLSVEYTNFQKLQKTLGVSEFRDTVMATYSADKAKLEKIISKGNFMPASKDIALCEIQKRAFDYLMMYTWELRDNENIKYETRDGLLYRFNNLGLPDNYFDILKSIDVQDYTTLMLGYFDSFINRYEYGPYFGAYSSTINIADSVIELVKNGTVNVDDQMMKLCEIYIANKKAREEGREEDVVKSDSVSNAQFSTFVNGFVPMVRSQNADSMIYLPAQARMRERVAKGKELWGDGGELITQIVIARYFRYDITSLEKEQAQKFLEITFEYVTEPRIRELLTDFVDEKYQDRTSSTSRPIPQGLGKEVIENLLAPHRGKYVMVDFWASGCGPCIGAINRTHELREQLSDKPVVFMFITAKNSTSSEMYDKYMTPTLGDKHHISADDWNKIAALFDINGIPRYILFGKDGQLIDDHFGGWGAIEKKIEELER